MNTILQRGATSGLLAGLILGVLFFVDYGPGASLLKSAGWFGLAQTGGAKWFGFLILVVLGGLFGLLFGLLQRNRTVELGRSLLMGLAMGLAWWVIVALIIGTAINHVKLDLGGFLYSFVMLLLYGVLLGSLFFQRSPAQTA
ncbi:MAG: hypothetical protein NVS2B12_29740 [Ktedonobacteraceae bacterium]